MIPHDAAWTLRRLTIGESVNGELAALTEPFRSMADYLNSVNPGKAPRGRVRREVLAAARAPLWEAMLTARENCDELVKALAEADPEGPPPEAETARRFANVTDLRRMQSEVRWIWDGWIPAGRVFGLAGFEGSGKTRTAMDFHRRVWHGLAWPDNQGPTLPPGRPAVWVCTDGHQDELAELVPAFGLPDDSVIFPSPSDEPYGGTDIDDLEMIGPNGLLEQVIIAHKPWCVFIDTLTSATSLDLCDQRVMKVLKTPLVRLAQSYGIKIGLMLHLSREGQALGRRIKGITRTLMHLECPNPDKQSGQLRFWVEKSYAKKPPALGVTLGSGGNDYDFNPPRNPETGKGGRTGRPPEARDKAERFIRDTLTRENGQISNELCIEWGKTGGSEQTFWRAVDELSDAGELTKDGGPGTRKQTVLHLNATDPERPF